jgi:hypothetical protein
MSALIEKQDFPFGLLYQCPKQKRSSMCPFNHLDRVDFIKRVEWVKRTPNKCLNKLLIKHHRCSNN